MLLLVALSWTRPHLYLFPVLPRNDLQIRRVGAFPDLEFLTQISHQSCQCMALEYGRSGQQMRMNIKSGVMGRRSNAKHLQRLWIRERLPFSFQIEWLVLVRVSNSHVRFLFLSASMKSTSKVSENLIYLPLTWWIGLRFVKIYLMESPDLVSIQPGI